MSTEPVHQECIDTCNSLLRGEISAVETFRQAKEKFAGQPQAIVLSEICSTHEDHVARIREHITSKGGSPDESSGAWGTFVAAVEGAAKLFGETTALQALIEGERHGISSYESALANDHVSAEAKDLYRSKFIPTLESNIARLEALQEVG